MFFPFHDDNPTRRTPVVTYALVGLNVAAFLWASQLPPPKQQSLVLNRGFIPARIAQLSDPKPLAIKEPVLVRHRFFGVVQQQRQVAVLQPNPPAIFLSLLTCMFLHANWAHILGNMWFLWLFGNNVEDRLGGALYLLFYLGGGILASGFHWMHDPTSTAPVIGASGAVAAILGGYAITWPWSRVHCLLFLFIFITIIDVPALLVLGTWFLFQVLEARKALGLGIDGGVAFWAHIGGFLVGLILMPLLSALVGAEPTKPPAPKPPQDDLFFPDDSQRQ